MLFSDGSLNRSFLSCQDFACLIVFCRWIYTDPTQPGRLRDFSSLNGFVKNATGQWLLQWRVARSLPPGHDDTLALRPNIAKPPALCVRSPRLSKRRLRGWNMIFGGRKQEERSLEVRGFEPLAFSLRTRRSTN